MQKKYQKITVIFIIAIISITLIGSSFVAMFLPGDEQSPEAQSKVILEQEYKNRQEAVQLLDKKLSENPNDTEVQLALADAYFDKSRVSGQINQEEYEQDLQKASALYQTVLTKKEDSYVMYKLAVTAFLRGDDGLAESTYKEILSKEPENAEALYGYGMLLFYNMKDYKRAEEKWVQALELTTEEQMKRRLEEMISLVKVINSGASEQKK